MYKHMSAVLFAAALVFAGCPNDTGDTENNQKAPAKTGSVTFHNESSYAVVVHLDAFSGPELLRLTSAGETKTADVRVSDNYGVGSVFSIEYLYQINDGYDPDSGAVFAGGLDPDVQINVVVEENKSYTVQIPQPKKLEFQSAFIGMLNSSNLQFELRYLGTAFKQAGNGNLPVTTGKTGIYKLDGIGADGKPCIGYTAVSTFSETPVPDFTAKKGVVYRFTYNGTSVEKTGEQTIVFN